MWTIKLSIWIIAGCYLSVASPGFAGASGQSSAVAVPVMVGGDDNLDACASVGVVSGLDANGDNFLSVRSGPGRNYDELDRIGSGQALIICDKNGPWLGVVYPPDQSHDCGLSTPTRGTHPYAGSCPQGWVFKDFVRLIAG